MSERLGRLATDLGERSTYDAVAQCSRCGYCEQACPTYVATGEESKSPRGRNQIVRLMIEGKLDDPRAAMESLSTCLTCGACTTACYAKVPVVDIVLEGRRMLRDTHWLVKRVSRLMIESPRLFAFLLKLGGVEDVHDLHLWSLTQGQDAMSGHLVIAAGRDHADALKRGKALLAERFGISHVTLQIERSGDD